MVMKILKMVVVDFCVEFGEYVDVGLFCVVGLDVKIGDGMCLISYVNVLGYVVIGCDNVFYLFCVIGGEL